MEKRQVMMPRILDPPPPARQCASWPALYGCFFARLSGLISVMPASEDSQAAPPPKPPASTTAKPDRPGRGRGRRGSSRAPRPPRSSATETPAASDPQKTSPPESKVPAATASEKSSPSAPATPAPPPPRKSPPASPPRRDALASAIGHAQHILKELREALAEMEEVLELLELARKQKLEDEQQIATLRRVLEQLHRSREQTATRPSRSSKPPASAPSKSS